MKLSGPASEITFEGKNIRSSEVLPSVKTYGRPSLRNGSLERRTTSNLYPCVTSTRSYRALRNEGQERFIAHTASQ
jgi:hypothetical protein